MKEKTYICIDIQIMLRAHAQKYKRRELKCSSARKWSNKSSETLNRAKKRQMNKAIENERSKLAHKLSIFILNCCSFINEFLLRGNIIVFHLASQILNQNWKLFKFMFSYLLNHFRCDISNYSIFKSWVFTKKGKIDYLIGKRLIIRWETNAKNLWRIETTIQKRESRRSFDRESQDCFKFVLKSWNSHRNGNDDKNRKSKKRVICG